ncbi:patatin-like phospholipase domain-containing protein 2 [Callorhinchus milii]|nr:patatin-like phospholipase domain-containing protein 2 [Callorhinchus milii]|eukprot:gi/632953331/ref/XP_007892360.1/ PREDICTED: patatin-like phospholipase domain-containing protein 2 [Callorhinchus milii]
MSGQGDLRKVGERQGLLGNHVGVREEGGEGVGVQEMAGGGAGGWQDRRWLVREGEHCPPQALSFCGSGFLVVYQIGAVQCLLRHVPQVMRGIRRVYGASAGSLIAAAVVCGVNLDGFYWNIGKASKMCREHVLGAMHPTFNMLEVLREAVIRNLPSNAHQLAHGKLFISLTRIPDGENVLVSDFASRDELVQVLVCSCFFPVYCGFIPPIFRGVRYIDGGLSNNQPLFDGKRTITISPFSGKTDICPSSDIGYTMGFSNSSYTLCPENLLRFIFALIPPHSEMLKEFRQNGYRDALEFLRVSWSEEIF